MLVDVSLTGGDSVTQSIAALVSDGLETKRLQTGIYQCGHWNFEFETSAKLEKYRLTLPDEDVPRYGVCDSIDQVLARIPKTLASDRKFLISMHLLKKADEKPRGWRWHKWGEYIGTQNPRCEYLYDEPDIEEVWTFCIYEVLSA
jgi:hypothetical protein